MKLPKIEVSSAKLHSQKVSHKMHASRSDIRHESPVGKLDASTSSSDVSSDEEQGNEEDGIDLNMEFYGPQFRKHRSLDEPLQKLWLTAEIYHTCQNSVLIKNSVKEETLRIHCVERKMLHGVPLHFWKPVTAHVRFVEDMSKKTIPLLLFMNIYMS